MEKNANQDDIKKAFRNLSKKHHPDHGGDAEKFKEINEAYRTLSNPEKRQQYDNPDPFGNNNPFGGFGFNMGPFGPRMRPRTDPNAPRAGQNIQLSYETPLHIFLLGGEIKVNISYDDVCPVCNGKGGTETEPCLDCNGQGVITHVHRQQGMTMQTSKTCPTCRGQGFKVVNNCDNCKGSGKIKIEDKEVVLKVAPGTRDGGVIGMVGEGRSGINGGPPGDLIVQLKMKYPELSELTEEQKEVLRSL